MQPITILVADDNAGFRQRIKEFLDTEPDLEVIAEAANGSEALGKARELHPDIVLMDVRMPGMNGITATLQIKEQVPDARVIILSRFDVEAYRAAAKANGASDYVLKRLMPEGLVPAIRRAVAHVITE